jgi:hypothetical protein
MKKPWIRGVITLGILGGLAAGLLLSPAGAAAPVTKAKVKKIVKKLTYTKAQSDARYLQQSGYDTVAFASVAAESGTPTVLNFGGRGTSSLTVDDLGVGHYRMIFNGTYGAAADLSNVTILCSIRDTDTFHVASCDTDGVPASSSSQIIFDVFVWTTVDASAVADKDISVMVLI